MGNIILVNFMDFFQLIGMLILFFIILFGAYFTTKWISRLQFQQNKGKNMQVIEVLRLTPNKMLQIVKINNRFFVISISKEHINLITELNKEEVKDNRNIQDSDKISFKEQLNQILNRGKKE
ncbi:MAG: FliO/MopB family protein [Eubacteriales bacterium]